MKIMGSQSPSSCILGLLLWFLALDLEPWLSNLRRQWDQAVHWEPHTASRQASSFSRGSRGFHLLGPEEATKICHFTVGFEERLALSVSVSLNSSQQHRGLAAQGFSQVSSFSCYNVPEGNGNGGCQACHIPRISSSKFSEKVLHHCPNYLPNE